MVVDRPPAERTEVAETLTRRNGVNGDETEKIELIVTFRAAARRLRVRDATA
jgi:hypothetical protein